MIHKFLRSPFLIINTMFLLSCSQPNACKGAEEINSSDIIQMLEKGQDINLEKKVIIGNLDFTLVQSITKVHTSLSQAVIKTSVSFADCRFTGKVICLGRVNDITRQTVFMQNAIFNKCEFEDIVDFQSTTVYGNVSFTGSKFHEQTLFNSFYAHSKTSYFGQITADKDFSMQDALFVGSCDFSKSQFNANVSFQGSRFDGAFNFSTVRCASRADFSKVRFNSNCLFNYTEFSGIARFNQLKVLGIADWIQVNFGADALFTNVSFFDLCRFNQVKAKAAFDFSSSLFYKKAPEMDKVELTNQNLYKPGETLQHQTQDLPKF